jgi:hypothetical protein
MSMWPPVLLHALSEVALQLGDVSGPWRWTIMIGGDTVLLVFGLVLLRPRPANSTGKPARQPDRKPGDKPAASGGRCLRG